MDDDQRRAAGRATRRTVLGDAHVDRAEAAATPFDADFQDLLTRIAWGDIWTRPGLDHTTRRLLVIATTIALNRDEEFALHVRAALDAGVSPDTLKEVILQSAIYCGLPAANAAFRRAGEIMRQPRIDR